MRVALLIVSSLVSLSLTGCGWIVMPSSRTSANQPDYAALTLQAAANSATHTVQKGETLATIAKRYNLNWQDLAKLNKVASPYKLSVGQKLILSAGATPATVTTKPQPTTVVTPQPVTVPSAPTITQPVTTPTTAVQPVLTLDPRQPVIPTISAEEEGPQLPATPTAAEGMKQVDRNFNKPAANTTVAANAQGSCYPPVNWQLPTSGTISSTISATGKRGIKIAGKVGQPIKAAAAGTVTYSGDNLQGYGNVIIIQHNEAFLSVYGQNRRRLVGEGVRVNAGQTIAEMGTDTEQNPVLHFEIRCRGKAIDPLPFLPHL